MEHIASMFNNACLAFTVILVSMLFLLSQPNNRLRAMILRVMSWLFTAVTTLLGIYILSPLDLLPDLIPFLGLADDIVALITALFAGVSIFVTRWAANRPFELPDEQFEETSHRKRLLPPRS